MDKISVIIPTYNREKIIKKVIQSTLKQTYHNIEVIVIDDGSTDNTEKVVKKIKDNRLKYIKLDKNMGVCNARNEGIKNAQGKYIAFQDSDNIFYSYKLEKQLDNLIKNKTDMNYCQVAIINGKEKMIFPNEETEHNLLHNSVLDELCKGNFIDTNTILIKKEVIDKYLFDQKTASCEDYDLLLRLSPNIKISHTKEVLVDNIIQNNSISMINDVVKNAVVNMINKDYQFTKEQKEIFNKSLINLIIFKTEKPLLMKIDELKKDYNELNKEHIKISNAFKDTIDRYHDLEKEIERLKNEIKLLNEKRIINRVKRLFK